jgi:hypothetical protein
MRSAIYKPRKEQIQKEKRGRGIDNEAAQW